MNRLRLAPVTAVTCNLAFEVIDDAEIQIEDSRIVYIGPRATAPPFEADETIGGTQFVALPGLINTHTHSAMTLLRGYADDMALEPWLQTKIWPFEMHLQGDDVYWGTQLAIAEMLQGGTTTFADMYHFYEHGVQAMIESGIRACPGAVLLGFLPEPQKRIEKGIAFVREYQGAGEGRIRPMFAPHSLYTCEPDQWESIINAARELDVPIETHVAETKQEVADVTAKWGATPVQTLRRIGALDGPLLAAHGVHLDERDWEILGEDRYRDAFRLAHNPTSNLKLASGFASVPRYIEAGVTVGIGTDGTASNNDLDMWEEMRLAALVHKATTGDPTVVSAEEALLMATREGAYCIGLEDEIGTLEVGKKADIVLVDFDKPHLTPRHNVVSHLVYAVKSSDVDSVIVDGKVLLHRGEFTRLDMSGVVAESNARAQKLSGLAVGEK